MCFALVAFPAYGKDITAEWDQEIFDGLTNWVLYASVDSPGGPYDYWESSIPYDGSEASHYTVTKVFPLQKGTHTYYFVLVAFAGVEHSSNSNEASVVMTGDIPAPAHFTVTITVQ